ncbi:MAG: quinate 5-dehydrogenase [Peptococcia bacterium]|jgi:hypothetical protein
MKRVVSVSLGSSCRDHVVETEIMGERFLIERIGTDGDFAKAIELVRSLDGKIDAFGMGGIDLYIMAGRKRYVLQDALRIKEAARKTPMVDGSGLKNTLERRTIHYLVREGLFSFAGKKVLLVCGVDRFGMAEALVEEGAKVTFGDLIFGLNIPIPLKSLTMLSLAGRTFGPLVSRLPFKYLYPTGEQQDVIFKKYGKYYELNEIIAGDFHFIKKYLPENIESKTILTNTVTSEDVELLTARGAQRLITSTPELDGRSFGTNVMEAALVALLGKAVEDITVDDYNQILDKANFKPRIDNLVKIETA